MRMRQDDNICRDENQTRIHAAMIIEEFLSLGLYSNNYLGIPRLEEEDEEYTSILALFPTYKWYVYCGRNP